MEPMSPMLANLTLLAYLVSAVLFILALKGLSSPVTSRRGNYFGMVGMLIAVVTTVFVAYRPILVMIGGAIVIGGTIGAIAARRVQMTKMPELVALMHSLVGVSAVLIAVASLFHYGEPHTVAQRVELFIGAFIGAITFTASLIAYGKLSGRVSGTPISFGGQHLLNLLLALSMIGFGLTYFMTSSPAAFLVMVAIALVLGITLIIPIGGADMPVVVSMLNSYSGWAAAGIGFTLNNSVLIIAGSCVGSSGAILSYIMCKAMNRSIIAVLLGGFGATAASAGVAAGERPYKSGSADDAAFLMSNAETVIIVPGYGLAVARAQHALKELSAKLTEHGVNVKYAIHPVAGRMPGHMNVLLAEAEVPYDQVAEMEDINGEFGQADVVLVLGANDVVNPAAKTDPTSSIAGMPILEAYKAKTIIVNKRSMAAGYAGLDNDLFYMDKTMMVFGDAKKVIEDMVKAVE
jgi:NAD(P) transhydrogenase subunit beta